MNKVFDKTIIGVKDWTLFLKCQACGSIANLKKLEQENGYVFDKDDLEIIFNICTNLKENIYDFLIFLKERNYDFTNSKFGISEFKFKMSEIRLMDIVDQIPELITKKDVANAKLYLDTDLNKFILKKYRYTMLNKYV